MGVSPCSVMMALKALMERKTPLQLADLAAVDDQIVLARQENHLLLDVRFMKMRAVTPFGVDARRRDEATLMPRLSACRGCESREGGRAG